MERDNPLSFQMLSREDITAEASPIHLRISGRHWPSDDWELPRYVKSDTGSTRFPLTSIVSGWGPEPRFWVLVFGHEIWRPRTDAVSAKLERHAVALVGYSFTNRIMYSYLLITKHQNWVYDDLIIHAPKSHSKQKPLNNRNTRNV